MSLDRPVLFQFVTNPICARYRFEIPGEALRQGNRVLARSFARMTAELHRQLLAHADAVAVQRLPMSPQLEKLLATWRAAGKKIIFDIDDDLFNLPPDCELAKGLRPDFCHRLAAAIAAADVVQCSTHVLANQIKAYNANITVLRNQMDAAPSLPKDPEQSCIVVAYAAGENHGHDWATIVDNYNKTIASLRKEQVRIETWIIGDRAIFDSVESKRKRFLPQLPFADYCRLLAKVDISLMPLADNRFNRSKSDIKFLEAASKGAVAIAAALVYSGSIRDGETGLLYRTGEDFERILQDAILDATLRRRIRRAAHAYVAEQRLIKHHISEWEDFYIDSCAMQNSARNDRKEIAVSRL